MLDQVHEVFKLVPAGKLALAAECVPLLPTVPKTIWPAARWKVPGGGFFTRFMAICAPRTVTSLTHVAAWAAACRQTHRERKRSPTSA